MAENIRREGASSPRQWGVPVLSTDPLLRPLPSISEAIKAGELTAKRPVSTTVYLLERQLHEANRRIALLPYTNLIGGRMILPVTSFRMLASELEANNGDGTSDNRNGTPITRQGNLVGQDGSEMRFQMTYSLSELDGESIAIPIKYEQNLKPFEGLARMASRSSIYGDYVVNLTDGDIDEVQTDMIPCSTSPDNNSPINMFLKQFLTKGQNVGYFFLNFSGLITEPSLRISIQKRMQRVSLCEYKFGKNVDYDEDILEGHASMNGVEPGNLNFYTYLDMLEESLNQVPTI